MELPDGCVVVYSEDLEDLKDAQLFLSCLEAAGVDNWEGYEYAQELYKMEKGESDI